MFDFILKLAKTFEKLAEGKFDNLQPDDVLTIYHGTRAANMPMIHGVDATIEHHRQYGGPRHSGLFVSPDPELAERFAGRGGIVIEFNTKADDLYGTDYSGNTYKKQIERGMSNPNDVWRETYPNSFSPYLSQTLSQSSEPQALFIGTLKPENITRIYWEDKWHSLDEFFESNPEYYPPYSQTPESLKRLSFDPTDGDISLNEMYQAIKREHGYPVERSSNLFKVYAENNPERLLEVIENLGWVPSAAKKLAQKVTEEGI